MQPERLVTLLLSYNQFRLIKTKCIMKLIKKPSNERIGNLIITIITALVSTFFMQSCMSLV